MAEILTKPAVASGPLGWLSSLCNAIGTLWIVALMLLIVADISARNILNQPIKGVPEMVAFSIVGIVFLQLSHALRSGALTRSDILLGYFQSQNPRIHRTMLTLFNLTGAAVLALALWHFLPSLSAAWSFPKRHFMGSPGVFTIPRWPLYGLMCLGLALTVAQFLALAWSNWREGRG